jgi:hypothetical protein
MRGVGVFRVEVAFEASNETKGPSSGVRTPAPNGARLCLKFLLLKLNLKARALSCLQPWLSHDLLVLRFRGDICNLIRLKIHNLWGQYRTFGHFDYISIPRQSSDKSVCQHC